MVGVAVVLPVTLPLPEITDQLIVPSVGAVAPKTVLPVLAHTL